MRLPSVSTAEKDGSTTPRLVSLEIPRIEGGGSGHSQYTACHSATSQVTATTSTVFQLASRRILVDRLGVAETARDLRSASLRAGAGIPCRAEGAASPSGEAISTGAIERYPRRGRVSIKRGLSASSPSAARNRLRMALRLPSNST